jgi:hypothetical protein
MKSYSYNMICDEKTQPDARESQLKDISNYEDSPVFSLSVWHNCEYSESVVLLLKDFYGVCA